MTILDEIRLGFTAVMGSGMDISSIDRNYPAIVLKYDNKYGVAIKIDENKVISEKFANCNLHTQKLPIKGEMNNYLIFDCFDEEYRNEFANICCDFVDPGKDGIKRKELLDEPLEWWSRWKKLMGNRDINRSPYSVIGEMLAYEAIARENNGVLWTGGNFGTHDVESDDTGYEVKTTLKKYEAEITVSSQFQLSRKKDLFLYFCRMEESKQGISINDMKKRFLEMNYDESHLEMQLSRLGFEEGSSGRNKRYKVLEKRCYKMDEEFPQITETSFKGDKFPQAIKKIIYTIDLEGLDYNKW